jgi:Carboxypeptidase regulatory-like domain/TonB-dependent Receptor Plug Domain
MRKLPILLTVVGLVLLTSSTLAQERFGGLTGTVTDQSGGVLPGVTVNVTNKTTGQVRSVNTGSDGSFIFPDLDPGRYSVRVELTGFSSSQVDDINILLGKTLKLDTQLRVGNLTETVTVSAETVPVIDLTTTTIAHNVTAEEFDRIPKTRSFQGVALTSPGVNQGDIEGGIQVNGASGAENTYTVDGLPTNSVIYGSSRQDTVFEYLQEVQVKTGGIDAQYGGALGGVISAVTKSGGNTFQGEGHYYYSGNGISAGPPDRIVLSPVDDQTVFHPQDDKMPNNRHEFGGSVGGPIRKDQLFFFGSLSPQLTRRTSDFLFSNGTEPDSINQDKMFMQAFGKVTYAKGRLRADGSVLTTPTRSTGYVPAYNGNGTNTLVSSLAANLVNKDRGFDADQTNVTGNLDIVVSSGATLSVRGGYFYDNYKDTNIPQTTSYTYQRTSVGAANIPAALQGPIGTFNTPRLQIANHDTTKRTYFSGDYTHAFSAAGTHLLKGGLGYQRTSNDVDSAYPNGYVYIYWNSAMTNFNGTSTGTGTYGYYRVDDFGTFGKVGGNIWSMYAQDAWAPTSRLSINVGVRLENEKVPTFNPDVQKYAFEFGFWDKFAPRLGVNYDVRGDGKMKVYASWGRYFDWTKYEIARGSFNGLLSNGQAWGDRWHIFYRSLDTLDIGSLNLLNMPGRDLWGSPTGFRDLRSTSIEFIDPDIKPMYQDSFNTGVEYQVGPTTVLGLHYVHNDLKRTIEDFSALVNGDNIYRIGNPGEGSSTLYPASFPTTADFPMPKPKRQYDAFTASINRRFARNWFAAGSYTYSRLYGNYAGLADSDEISTPTTNVTATTAQQQGGSIARPGSNSHIAWDTDVILWDAHGNLDPQGRLATDRPHVVKLYGAYTFPIGTQVGLNYYGGSGTPVTTYVNSTLIYYPMVNGRGDLGRTPFLNRTDLLLSHELRMQGSKRVRLELNVINLFNQKTATHIFNFLNKGAPGGSSTIPADAIDMSKVNLAAGYDYNALIRATADGANAFDPRYGQADLWNPGLQGQFMVKFIF